MLRFQATCHLYGWSQEYDKEMIDLSIYTVHLFRLPNQTVAGKRPKTKHVVDGSELKNYVLIASEDARSIDDIKTKADKLAEWKPGEDDPDLLPPNEEKEVEIQFEEPDEEVKDEKIEPEPEERKK